MIVLYVAEFCEQIIVVSFFATLMGCMLEGIPVLALLLSDLFLCRCQASPPLCVMSAVWHPLPWRSIRSVRILSGQAVHRNWVLLLQVECERGA